MSHSERMTLRQCRNLFSAQTLSRKRLVVTQCLGQLHVMTTVRVNKAAGIKILLWKQGSLEFI